MTPNGSLLDQVKVGGDHGKGPPISFLAASKTSNHLVLAVAGGSMRLYDLRQSNSKAAAQLKLRSSSTMVSLPHTSLQACFALCVHTQTPSQATFAMLLTSLCRVV